MTGSAPLGGRYHFLRQLRGVPPGVVWLASDSESGRIVIASTVTAARGRGIQRAVGVTHPHLASILDHLTQFDPTAVPSERSLAPGTSVGVAEFVAGQTLHERVDSAPLSPRAAVESILHITQAVAVLHSCGATHGAISPRAVIAERSDGRLGPTLTNLRTPPNGAFCSPERVRGGGPSVADDVWALAATLFAAAAGQPPFYAESREALAQRILSGPLPRLADLGVYDNALQTMLARCFALELSGRISTCAELERELTEWLRAHPPARSSSLPPPTARAVPPKSSATASSQRRAHEPRVEESDRQVAPAPPAQKGEAPAVQDSAAAGLSDEEAEDLATKVMDSHVLEQMLGQARSEAEEREVEFDEETIKESPSTLPAPPRARPAAVPADDSDIGTVKIPAIRQAEALMQSSSPAQSGPSESELRATPALQSADGPVSGAASGVRAAEEIEDRAFDRGSAEHVPQRRRKSRATVVLLALALMVVAGVGSFFVTVHVLPGPKPGLRPSATGSSHPAEAIPPPSSTSTLGTADGGGPEESTVVDADVQRADVDLPESSGEAGAAGLQACIASLFPDNSLLRDEEFEHLCTSTDPRKIADRFQVQLVHAGAGQVSGAMKIWSALDWFELPVLAILRSACCSGALPMEVPPSGDACPSFGSVVQATPGKLCASNDPAGMIDEFDAAVGCLYRENLPRPYSYAAMPTAYNKSAYREFLEIAMRVQCRSR